MAEINWYRVLFTGVFAAAVVGVGLAIGRRFGLRRPALVMILVALYGSATYLVKPALDARLDPLFRRWQFERTMSSMELYRVLQEYDPAAYRQIVTTATEATGQSEAEIISRTRAALGERLQRYYLPRASDQALVSWYVVNLLQLEHLSTTNPHLCVARIGGGGGASYDNAKLNAKEQAAVADIIRSSMERVEPIRPNEAEAERTVQEAIETADLSPLEAQALIKADSADPETLCVATVKYLQAVLRFSNDRIANVVRAELPQSNP